MFSQRRPIFGYLFCIVLPFFVLGSASAQSATLKENDSGKRFNKKFKLQNQSVLDCTGVACRKVTFFSVQVFAIGHYMDMGQSRESLIQFKKLNYAQLKSNKALFSAICQLDVNKQVEMRFLRSADASRLQSAIRNGLKRSMKSLSKNANELLAALKFGVTETSTLKFCWRKGHELEIFHNTKSVFKRQGDKQLLEAIWKIWFGAKLDDDNLKEIKSKLVKQLPILLQRSKP